MASFSKEKVEEKPPSATKVSPSPRPRGGRGGKGGQKPATAASAVEKAFEKKFKIATMPDECWEALTQIIAKLR
jgi:hypothetical protein